MASKLEQSVQNRQRRRIRRLGEGIWTPSSEIEGEPDALPSSTARTLKRRLGDAYRTPLKPWRWPSSRFGGCVVYWEGNNGPHYLNPGRSGVVCFPELDATLVLDQYTLMGWPSKSSAPDQHNGFLFKDKAPCAHKLYDEITEGRRTLQAILFRSDGRNNRLGKEMNDWQRR